MAQSLVNSAQQVADLALEQVKKAAKQGTFAVGGVLIDNRTGKVIYSQHNRVVGRLRSGDPFPLDPTNHGERQIVSWYYANRKRLRLPSPKQLTVVTSLDPCAMCAGCLTTAGFNVAVIAPDDYAGINWNNQVDYPNVPSRIRAKLNALFGYYSVADGPSFRANYEGGDRVAFKDQKINKKVYDECLVEFIKTVEDARFSISQSGLKPEQLKDPSMLRATSPTRKSLKSLYKGSLSLKLTEKQNGNQFYKPSDELRTILEQLKKRTPGATNAVALIDPFGNLLLAAADRFDISPIQTAFMNVIQEYSALRFKLADTQSRAPGDYKTSEGFSYLTSPKYCTFVFLHNLDYGETTTLKDLGVYGSSMEGPVGPGNFVYLSPPANNGTNAQIKRQVESLPPLYWELIGIHPKLELSPGSTIKVTRLRDQSAVRKNSLRWAIEEANKRPDFSVIKIKSSGRIQLRDALPAILYPTQIINASGSALTLDGGGKQGLLFKPKAKGSTVEGIDVVNTRRYGVRFNASSPSLLQTQFGVDVKGKLALAGSSNVKLGSIENQGSIERWQLKGFSRNVGVQPGFTISGLGSELKATLLVVRSDQANTPISLQFRNINTAGTAGDSQSLKQASSGGYGGQAVASLGAGSWAPEAYLPNGERLKLTWLDVQGGSGVAEFTASGANPDTTKEYVAQTFRIVFSLGSIGNHSSLPPGSLPLTVAVTAAASAEFGFYSVIDPLIGSIADSRGFGINPGESSYLQTAISNAKLKGWWFDSDKIQQAIQNKSLSLPGFSPGDNLAVVVSQPSTANVFSSYPSAGSEQANRILQATLLDGTASFNIELGQGLDSSEFDFQDLRVNLLANPFPAIQSY